MINDNVVRKNEAISSRACFLKHIISSAVERREAQLTINYSLLITKK